MSGVKPKADKRVDEEGAKIFLKNEGTNSEQNANKAETQWFVLMALFNLFQ